MNKSDYLFVSAPENVAWILNIRGRDGPNSPMPNSRLIISKTKKIIFISEIKKAKKIIKDGIIKLNELVDVNNFAENTSTPLDNVENTIEDYEQTHAK